MKDSHIQLNMLVRILESMSIWCLSAIMMTAYISTVRESVLHLVMLTDMQIVRGNPLNTCPMMQIELGTVRQIWSIVWVAQTPISYFSSILHSFSSTFPPILFQANEKKRNFNIYLCDSCTHSGLTWALFVVSPVYWKQNQKKNQRFIFCK